MGTDARLAAFGVCATGDHRRYSVASQQGMTQVQGAAAAADPTRGTNPGTRIIRCSMLCSDGGRGTPAGARTAGATPTHGTLPWARRCAPALHGLTDGRMDARTAGAHGRRPSTARPRARRPPSPKHDEQTTRWCVTRGIGAHHVLLLVL